MSGSPADSSVASLPLSDPRCNSDSCLAFKAAHNASQAAISYYWQYEYGHWTTWYYVIIIGCFAIVHTIRLLRDRRRLRSKEITARHNNSQSGIVTRSFDFIKAAVRSMTYRRLHGRLHDRLSLPSVGMLLFLSAAVIFFIVATFAVQPYYRERRGYGSPPLAVRTGLMAVACTPILVALAGKANFVTLLTGYGHEKLNVIHRYVAWMCLGLSIVHTIPFIIAPLNDGGYAALRAQFYKPGGFEYTGVPPLALLIGLAIFSIPWVRHRFYETFWHLHVLMAITYIGLMFWHAGQEQDSWAYMWATLAVFIAQIIFRFFYYNRAFNLQTDWFRGSPTSLVALSGGAVSIKVFAQESFTWRVGQHAYLRFFSLVLWHNHPFTITNCGKLASLCL